MQLQTPSFGRLNRPRVLFAVSLLSLLGLQALGLPGAYAQSEEAPPAIQAAVVEQLELDQGKIVYGVTHPLASFEGELNERSLMASLRWSEDEPESLTGKIEVQLLGFSSGNKARDNHARRSLKTKVFPSASLSLQGLSDLRRRGDSSARGTCRGEMSLHGNTARWPVEVELRWSEEFLYVTSNFVVLLDDFEIPRDKLFGMAIRNEVPVSVELRLRRP